MCGGRLRMCQLVMVRKATDNIQCNELCKRCPNGGGDNCGVTKCNPDAIKGMQCQPSKHKSDMI